MQMWKNTPFPKDEELDAKMEEMGIPIVSGETVADKQRRYIDALRYQTESRAWVFALIAAFASLASALAAWCAVLLPKC